MGRFLADFKLIIANVQDILIKVWGEIIDLFTQFIFYQIKRVNHYFGGF